MEVVIDCLTRLLWEADLPQQVLVSTFPRQLEISPN